MTKYVNGDLLDSFSHKLCISRGQQELTDMEILKKYIPGCDRVKKTTDDIDKQGVDYIAYLRKGATLMIDGKTRDTGCSKYWKDGPELIIEKWSVMPGGKYHTPKELAKTGWTLNEKSNVDLILFSFPPEDCDIWYLLPFQHLRMAYIRNFHDWHSQYRNWRSQSVNDYGKVWESECVYVPALVVVNAIKSVSLFQYTHVA